MRNMQQILDEEMQDEIKWRAEHEEMHAKHRGHDAMHAEMLLILIVALVLAQIILVQWKRRHFRSYQISTLIGMIFIPLFISIHKGFWRFIAIWLVHFSVSLYIYKLTTRPHISGKTPRLIYTWFVFIHKFSSIVCVTGYFVMMSALLGLNFLFGVKTTTFMDLGIILMFYGLYFGVCGRDVAHVCTEHLACRIGYFTHDFGLPARMLESNVCAVCGNYLKSTGARDDEETTTNEERTYTLSCNHTFHEFCIRGWVVVGKQQTCPYCKEKVDLQRMFKNPWEKPHLLYGRFLGWVRYLVAWQPLIIFLVQGLNKYLGLE